MLAHCDTVLEVSDWVWRLFLTTQLHTFLGPGKREQLKPRPDAPITPEPSPQLPTVLCLPEWSAYSTVIPAGLGLPEGRAYVCSLWVLTESKVCPLGTEEGGWEEVRELWAFWGCGSGCPGEPRELGGCRLGEAQKILIPLTLTRLERVSRRWGRMKAKEEAQRRQTATERRGWV